MNAAVFSRWNGPGALTPSARKTARVRSSPIRRSVPDGSRSLGAYTSIIGIVVPLSTVTLLRMLLEQPSPPHGSRHHERRLRQHRNVTAVDGFSSCSHPYPLP